MYGKGSDKYGKDSAEKGQCASCMVIECLITIVGRVLLSLHLLA